VLSSLELSAHAFQALDISRHAGEGLPCCPVMSSGSSSAVNGRAGEEYQVKARYQVRANPLLLSQQKMTGVRIAYARRMGQPTQRATNYTARSNIDTAQIFLHANGQRPKRAMIRQRSRRRQRRGEPHTKHGLGVSHNICGLCVPRGRCPVVSLSLRLNRESELDDVSCVLTLRGRSANRKQNHKSR